MKLSDNKLITAKTIVVGWVLKDKKYNTEIYEALWPIQKKNKDLNYSRFCDGSCVHLAMIEAGILEKYFTPIYRTYQTFKFNEILELQNVYNIFSNISLKLKLNFDEWMIINENGEKHERSDEFVSNYREFLKAGSNMKSILNYE